MSKSRVFYGRLKPKNKEFVEKMADLFNANLPHDLHLKSDAAAMNRLLDRLRRMEKSDSGLFQKLFT